MIPMPTSCTSAPASRGLGPNRRAAKATTLFTDCILAVRGATGKLVWYYQEVPGDNWDLDSIADLMLLDLADQRQAAQSDDARAEGWILLCAGSADRRAALGRSMGNRELGLGREFEDRPAR